MANEFQTIFERDAPALAPGRTPAKIRAIDDQGSSVNINADQTAALVLTDVNKPRIQELAGFDYSKEGEQDTGEVWITPDGQIKKVYARTWRGATPNQWSDYAAGQPYAFKYFVLPSSDFRPSAVWLEVGMIGANAEGTMLNTLPLKNEISGAIQISYSGYLGGITVSHFNASGLTGQPYSITVKYVK